MLPTLTAYCFDWHITTSPAFRHLLSDPLAPYMNVAFDAPPNRVTDTDTPPPADPVIFCQRVPFASWLADDRARLVWIPMWDLARHYPQSWWDALPKTLRVVAFSDRVAAHAQAAGLPTLHLRYFKPPEDFPPVDWDAPRTLMYWNRTGLLSRSALKRLCRALEVERVLFRPTLDPHIARAAGYVLPHKLGRARTKIMPDFMPREDYLRLLADTHIYVAPREVEGVGMTFLEAMASSAVVVAANAPTMNEYITAGENGLLLPLDVRQVARNDQLRTFKRYPFVKRWRRRLLEPLRFRHPIRADHVDTKTLRTLDLTTLGNTARQYSADGHAVWQTHLAEYAQFFLDW